MATEKKLPKKIMSLSVLREALEQNHGCRISERKLAAALSDDRSPQKQAEAGYEVDRIYAWLVEHEVVADPNAAEETAIDIPAEETSPATESADEETLDQLHAPGTVLCSWCGIPARVQSTDGLFQYFKKCDGCGHRPAKQVRKTARTILQEQANRNRQQRSAVERP